MLKNKSLTFGGKRVLRARFKRLPIMDMIHDASFSSLTNHIPYEDYDDDNDDDPYSGAKIITLPRKRKSSSTPTNPQKKRKKYVY